VLSSWDITIPTLGTASQLDIVFNDGAGVWDNNNGQDWQFTVTGATQPGFTMDGALDGAAALVSSAGGQSLYAAMDGDVLYVATDDAGEGDDVFIYVALSPGAMTAANWAKAGQIAQWDAYLADENDNGFVSWFDVTGLAQAMTGANGGVLEGTIDLVQLFGFLPSEVYLAVGRYQSADGGSLTSQTPGTADADGDIDAVEYILFNISAPIDGDLNGDGFVGVDDLNLVLAAWNQNVTPGDTLAGDWTGDGFVGVDDLNAVLINWNAGTPPPIEATDTVPEPGTVAVWGLLGLGLLRRGRQAG
jgi:carbohydrate binding protein with CBM25 domain